MHVFRAEVFKTLNKLYADNGAHLTSYEWVSSIDAEVLVIFDRFPWFMNMSNPSAFAGSNALLGYDDIRWQHHLLQSSICMQRIRMYRPFLRSAFHDECWPKCIDAIEGTFAVYHAIRLADPQRFHRSQKMLAQSYQIFCAAVSAAVFLLVERPLPPDRMQGDIEVVIQDLQHLTENDRSIPLAVDGRATLEKLLEVYRHRSPSANDESDDGSSRAQVQNWQAIIPEIYAVMGGRSKTKDYLESHRSPSRTRATHAVSLAAGSRSPALNEGSRSLAPIDTMGVARPSSAADDVYMMQADYLFPQDTASALDLNLHFDVLNWGIKEFDFGDIG